MITEGTKVEFVGADDSYIPNGTVGRVDAVQAGGWCVVEFVGYGLTGSTYDVEATDLRAISDDQWNAAMGVGGWVR